MTCRECDHHRKDAERLRRELEHLQSRLAEITATKARYVFPADWRLTPTHQRILTVVHRMGGEAPIETITAIAGRGGTPTYVDNVRTQICHMNKRLRPFRFKVVCRWRRVVMPEAMGRHIKPAPKVA